ncbi:MAG: restriction endonuclease [Candidatus Nitrosopelagicus sp.]|nr:restriction endonuclease [Candidatus Nitrosopelagicus sp.]
MNTKLLMQAISGVIPGGISTKDFAAIISTDKNTAEKILDMLTQNGIGQTIGNLVNFEDGDKLKTALFAIKNGVPIEEVSRYIDWKDFEGLVAEILDSKHFDVLRNFRLTKPTMEIDVVGVRLGIALIIDCKHWKRLSHSALETIVVKQVERVKHYMSNAKDVIAAPVIVTLNQEETSFISKVPIVPILQLSSFIDEFYGSMEEIKTIEK